MRRRLASAGAAALAATLTSQALPQAPATPRARTASLVVLGTGTPNADPDRSGPALAVVVNGTAYLVDAGPGIVRRAAAAQRQGIDALAPKLLDNVFITHLHSDHTVGLPDLIFTPWVLERVKPLAVYGPPGVKAMTDHLEAAYAGHPRAGGWRGAGERDGL